MKIASFLVAFALGQTVWAATEESLQHTFRTVPGGRLVVDVDFGSVEVTSHAADEVVVDVWRKVRARSESREKEFLAERPVQFVEENGGLTVRSRKSGSGWKWDGTSTEGRYRIRVPARFNLKLETAGGHIHVAELGGEVQASTSGGGLRFARVKGPVIARTSGGSVEVQDGEGTQRYTTSGGRIEVAGGQGTLEASTSGGSVKVRDFAGPAELETSGGSITVSRVGGAVRAGTSGGSITAEVAAPVPGSLDLSTSGGGITVRVPETAAFQVDARTSAGGCRSALPVASTGKVKPDRLEGTVNGGGPLMRLRTSAGSIRLEKGAQQASR